MDLIQYLGSLRLYKPDVLCLALGVTLLTSLIKKTLLKNCEKKVYFFLPFAIGFFVYLVYRLLVTMSLSPLSGGFADTLEGGFACGCAATVYYIVYKQFFRAKESENPVYPLLEGLIPDDKRKEAAELLSEAGQELQGEELRAFALSIFAEYSPELSEAEKAAAVAALCALLEKLYPKNGN